MEARTRLAKVIALNAISEDAGITRATISMVWKFHGVDIDDDRYGGG